MVTLGFYTGLLGILYLFLSYRVVVLRRKEQVGIGDGNVEQLSRAIRTHANFTEYVPLCLILLAILNNYTANQLIIHICGAVLVISRVLHAIGLSKASGKTFGRFWGTLLTWLLILGLSIVNILIFIGNLF